MPEPRHEQALPALAAHAADWTAPQQPNSSAPRPAWWLFAVAFGIAPVVAGIVATDALSWLMTYLVNAWHIVDDRQAIQWLRLVVHSPLPLAVTFAVLRFSPLGRWLALTPLTVMLFLAADAGLAFVLLDRLNELGLNATSVMRRNWFGDTLGFLTQTVMCLAIAMLVLGTAWYRCIVRRPRWVAACRRLLEER